MWELIFFNIKIKELTAGRLIVPMMYWSLETIKHGRTVFYPLSGRLYHRGLFWQCSVPWCLHPLCHAIRDSHLFSWSWEWWEGGLKRLTGTLLLDGEYEGLITWIGITIVGGCRVPLNRRRWAERWKCPSALSLMLHSPQGSSSVLPMPTIVPQISARYYNFGDCLLVPFYPCFLAPLLFCYPYSNTEMTNPDKPSGVRGVSWRDQETLDLIAIWGG